MSSPAKFPDRPQKFDQLIAFYPVRDLAETSHFYGNTLGLELVRDQGVCRIYRVGAEAYLGFCTHMHDEPLGSMIITLVTPEVDTWHSFLITAGVPCSSPPTYNSRFGIYHAFYRDPNGYAVEIQQFDLPLEG